jgi:hypothetical protein
MTLDAGLMQTADPVLRELGLSNEQAGKLLPLAQGVMARTQEALLAQFADAAAAQKRAWAEEFAADPKSAAQSRPERASGRARSGCPGLWRRTIRSARPWPTAALATTPT